MQCGSAAGWIEAGCHCVTLLFSPTGHHGIDSNSSSYRRDRLYRRAARAAAAGGRIPRALPGARSGAAAGKALADQVEVAAGDCLRAETLPAAMQGVEVAFYMVHSMAGGHDFEQRDVLAARNFATAAQAAGVRRIIYLGGLGDPDTALSGHLRSRQETGAVLRECGVPVGALTPRLSSYWVHLVTPVPAVIARPLIQGLRNDVIVRDDPASPALPADQAAGLCHRRAPGPDQSGNRPCRNRVERCLVQQPGRRCTRGARDAGWMIRRADG